MLWEQLKRKELANELMAEVARVEPIAAEKGIPNLPPPASLLVRGAGCPRGAGHHVADMEHICAQSDRGLVGV